MGIKASCHFHLTAKLDVYHSLSCLLPSFLSLARGPQRITQERPVGHSTQTALLLQSTASESETWLNLATHLLTAFSGFMIKMFSADKWGRVTFPAVSLLMLLIHFTRRLISNVTMNEGGKSPNKYLTGLQSTSVHICWNIWEESVVTGFSLDLDTVFSSGQISLWIMAIMYDRNIYEFSVTWHEQYDIITAGTVILFFHIMITH